VRDDHAAVSRLCDFPLHDRSSYRGLHVRREMLIIVTHSMAIFIIVTTCLTPILRFATFSSLYDALHPVSLLDNGRAREALQNFDFDEKAMDEKAGDK
jgi:hypothetical protein